MRQGQVFKRCTACGVKVTERRCPKCDGKRATWAFVVDVAPPGGNRKQVKRGGFATKAEALATMGELQEQARSGGYLPPSKLTLRAYLHDAWLPAMRGRVRAGSLRQGTYDSYELHVNRYLAPEDGTSPIADVALQQLEQAGKPAIKAFYGILADRTRERGQGVLSPKTVHNVHLTLSKALADAVEDRLIARNPAAGAHKQPEAPEMKTWTPAQLNQFLEHVRDDRLYALWRLAVTTGLRRGELIGLRWSDLDLATSRLQVARQRVKGGGTVTMGAPKTRKGRRTIALDLATVAAFRAHRKAQLGERLAAGGGYLDDDLVFCHEDGRPFDPDGITQRFARHVREAGLPRIRLHDVRHSYATASLRAGVPLKVVSERIGHSKTSITGDTYQHAVPELDEQAASVIAAVIDQAIEQRDERERAGGGHP